MDPISKNRKACRKPPTYAESRRCSEPDTPRSEGGRGKRAEPSVPRVLPTLLCARLSRPRRDDGRARTARRSYQHLPLGPALCPRTRQTLSTAPESLHRFLESRRDLRQSPQNLDVSLPGGRLRWQHARVSLEPDARCRGGSTLLGESAALHGVFSSSRASGPGAGGSADCSG